MRGRVEPDLAAAVPGAPQLLDAFEALLKANPSGHCEAAVANTRPGTGRSLSWPWTQAMGNIAWAVSQASGARTGCSTGPVMALGHQRMAGCACCYACTLPYPY